MNGHLVKDWMTTDTITIPSRGTLPEAYWLMIKNDIRRLPVVDNDVLVGIVTLEDLRRAESARTVGLDMIRISDMLAKLPIHQIMVKEPITIKPTDTLLDTAAMMLEYKISAFPVMDSDELVGIITESDIFRALIYLEKNREGSVNVK
jgi:acetoin utilization protein AcuB